MTLSFDLGILRLGEWDSVGLLDRRTPITPAMRAKGAVGHPDGNELLRTGEVKERVDIHDGIDV